MDLISYITPTIFGVGAISSIADELRRLQITRPLIITDKGIVDAGILGQLTNHLADMPFTVFDGTDENPTEANLDAALSQLNSHTHDGLIAIGGGSPMDLAKAVALIASQGGCFSDYDVKIGGSEQIRRVLPHIAIPTAAGTGAEIGRACVLTTNDGVKRVAVSLEMVAHSIICDPALTLSLPARLTAATGIDALSHGIEAFLSPRYNPPADAIALDCIARIANNIETATSEAHNIQARTDMLMGALQGGMVLQKGLGSAHAMATPLGEFHIHHGTLIAVLLPHVLAFNASHITDKIASLNLALGIGKNDSPADWLATLITNLGLPTSLSELGVDDASLEQIAKRAEADHLSATNPRPASAADYLGLLQSAYRGTL
jgi:4-hydroxybutyrate dehydrogenase